MKEDDADREGEDVVERENGRENAGFFIFEGRKQEGIDQRPQRNRERKEEQHVRTGADGEAVKGKEKGNEQGAKHLPQDCVGIFVFRLR